MNPMSRLWLWRQRLHDEIAVDAVIAARSVHAVGSVVVGGALLGGFPSAALQDAWLTVTAGAFAIAAVVTGAQVWVGPRPSISTPGRRAYENWRLIDGVPTHIVRPERVQNMIWGARAAALGVEAVVVEVVAKLA